MTDKKLELETVANMLTVSITHVKRLLDAGELKGVNVGVKENTGKRVYLSSVIEFEERRKINP